ncbi:MAG: sensor histidine kinase [Magnetococcales bacterium]|nr:sensor histidine kinase [Magnetococcales bacterium]
MKSMIGIPNTFPTKSDEIKRLILLGLIMTVVSLIVGSSTIGILYDAAFDEQQSRLEDTVHGQRHLMEAVAKFDQTYNQNYPEGAKSATFAQIIEAQKLFKGFGRTGELTVAHREGERIVFISESRHQGARVPESLPVGDKLAMPMQRALNGEAGSMIGLDYRGEMVLAAYQPVSILEIGIVVKIDLSEIREPFIRAISLALGIALVVILAGTALFYAVSNPIIRQIKGSEQRLRSLTVHLQTVREAEQKRIASELHDELGSLLTQIRMTLAAGRESLGQGAEASRNHMEKASSLTKQVMVAIRRIMASLRPKILDQLGVLAALEWQAQQIADSSGIHYEIDPASQNLRLGEERETIVFRIGQEALTNVVKHADAGLVKISLTMDEHDVILEITDDGKGFPMEPMIRNGHMGVQSMMERARQVGGKINLVTPLNGGASVIARLPRMAEDRIEE